MPERTYYPNTHTGKFLHKLHIKKTDEDTSKTMIAAFPTSFGYKIEFGRLQIYGAMSYSDSVHYIPFLTKEGVKFNVAGEDALKGLLVQDCDASA